LTKNISNNKQRKIQTQKHELSTEEAMRYSRQIMLNGFDLDKQEVLRASTALVIGLGGLGCAAAQYLVASGVGSLTLVDDDSVESTNLQRQILHNESSIGALKVDSAFKALSALNSDVNLHKIARRLNKEELQQLLMKHNVVLDCSDNLATRNLLNEVCYSNGTALISGAAIRMEGQVFCVSPQQRSACYACISHFFGEQNLSCAEAGVMSPLVGVIGSMQALEAIKAMTDFGQLPINKLQVFDATSAFWQSFKVEKRSDCAVCSSIDNSNKR
jgi:adenylyltransferase/sulfurtransferase